MLQIRQKLLMIMIMTGILASMGAGCDDNNPTGPIEHVFITYPSNGASVPDSIQVLGTYTDDFEGSEWSIWVILWPEDSPGIGWPQSDNAVEGTPAVKNNGSWSVTCWFTGPPQSYDIAVYTGTAEASRVLVTLLIDSYRRDEYSGILEINLPAGLVERDRITISKQ